MFAMQCDPTEFLIARGCWIINQVFCNFVVCVGLRLPGPMGSLNCLSWIGQCEINGFGCIQFN